MGAALPVCDKSALPRPVLPGRDGWLALWDLAWELLFRNVKDPGIPGWKPFLTCFPGVDMIWQWDSCVMSFITNWSNGTVSAFDNLDDLYALRRESDGFMAMAYDTRTGLPSYPEFDGRINPPLMAWAEREHLIATGDASRLPRVLPALEGFFGFVEARRRRCCGLYYFEDPGSSGMDNSPRGGYCAARNLGSDVCFVDLACQQALSARCIADLARALGDGAKAARHEAEYDRIRGLADRFHWCPRDRFYHDFFARDRPEDRVKFLGTKTAAAFWTLTAGIARGDRLRAMVDHLFDPAEFYTPVPFASLSRDDLNYDPDGGYWLGSVWAPTNLAAIRGLADNGFADKAREASLRYLDAMVAVAADPALGPSIWECYAPEDPPRPATTEKGERCGRDFVGWSGLAPITLLVENAIGLRRDVPARTLHWQLPDEPLGLENFRFGEGLVSAVCLRRSPEPGGTVLRVETDVPLVLRATVAGPAPREASFDLAPGAHELRL